MKKIYLVIHIIRFNLVGYDASEWSFTLERQTEYLALLDEFLAECEKQKIGVILSFFWHYRSLSDYCNEGYHQWGNPNSKTFKTMQDFTTVIVERYKENPVIWGWEAPTDYVMSLHIYPDVETGWGGVAYFGQDTFKEIIASYMEVAKQMNRVCFVGEFGVSASSTVLRV
jgi:hypothetical protein